MKNELKISTLALVCVLCTAVSAAYGASSVRSLGGSGTYSSASSAAAANSGSANSAAFATRGGSLRVTPTAGKTGTVAKPVPGTTNSGRIATTPRLSIGKYLGGGTSISGGSSIRPQGPGGSTSGSSGGTIDPGLSADLQLQVDQLNRDVEKLKDEDIALADKLLEKQNLLNTTADGYIIIDDTTNEIFVDVENLKTELNTIAGKDGREVEIGSDANNLLWRYVGDATWNILISKDAITGPQGPQGEKGEKGEPGDAASVDLTEYAKTADIAAAYATTTAMNTAIAAAINAAAANYATAAQGALAESALQPGALTGYATKVDVANMATTTDLAAKADKATTLSGYGITDGATKTELTTGLAAKANAADVYTKVQTDAAIETAVDGVVAGELTGYAKTADVNAALDLKADKTQFAGYATTTDLAAKADTTTVNTLSGRVDTLNTEIGEINTLATDAATAAASALSTAGTAQSTATAANTAAGEAKTAAAEAKTAANTAGTNATEAKELATAANTAATAAGTTATAAKTAADAATTALAGKADKATTLAGYGITDAYTTTQIDKKLEDITVGGLDGVEAVLATKADKTYVDTQLETKADKSSLGTLATKNAIVNADVADNAAIAKTKLAADVQTSLTKADQAVSTSDAPSTGDHVLAVSNGEKTWFEVVY